MPPWLKTLPYLYMLVDIAITNLSYGLFSTGWNFNTNALLHTITFSNPYKFTSSPYEFQLFLCFRMSLWVTGIVFNILNKKDTTNSLFPVVLSNAVLTCSLSLAKFLAFADNPEQLYYPGVWISVFWTILSGFIQVAVWNWVFSENLFDYNRLNNVSTLNVEEATLGLNSGNSSNLESETPIITSPRKSFYTVLKRLLAYCAHQWPWFMTGFFFLTVFATARVLIPTYVSQVIADLVNQRGFDSILRSTLIVFGLTLIGMIFGSLRGGCFTYATALLTLRVRLDLFTSLINQDIAFFDATKTGETLSRLTSDCQAISSNMSTNVNYFMRNFVMLVGSLFMMFTMSWRLTTVCFIVGPLFLFITKAFSKFYDKISEKVQETIAKSNQKAQETLSTMRTVRSFACEEREIKNFEGLLSSTVMVNRKRAIAIVIYNFTNDFSTDLAVIAVLSYGGYLVITGKLEKEQLLTFLLYQLRIADYTKNLSYILGLMIEAVGASRKVFDLMDREPQFELNGVKQPVVEGRLSFSNVGFTYPSRPKNPVIKDLTLSIEAGETVALVGPSGGGKSSIVSLIEHFYEPTDGTITLDDVPIRDIDHEYYHQKIALVAQEPVLYNGTVRQNILYGCDFATEEDMLKASKMANCHDFILNLEKGYDSECGERGVQMSGGQKQRIAIARALVRNPAVLILDEATSALDMESEFLVQQSLKKCAEEMTVIIIAHRLSTIKNANKIAVIVKGHIVQLGTHDELMIDHDGMYYSLVSRQTL